MYSAQREITYPWAQKIKNSVKSGANFMLVSTLRSHMSRALDGTEKNIVQKLGHLMLVQPILSQKNQKSKFFNEPFFCNWMISIFPYIKLVAKWRKNGSLCAVNCLNLFKNALYSLLNKHWYKAKTFRIQSCSVQWRYMHETLILRQKLSP